MTINDNRPTFIKPYSAEAAEYDRLAAEATQYATENPTLPVLILKHTKKFYVKHTAKILVGTVGAFLITGVVVFGSLQANVKPAAAILPPPTQTLTVSEYAEPQIVSRDTFTVVYVLGTNPDTILNFADSYVNDQTKQVQYPFRVGVSLSDKFGERPAVCEEEGCKETINHYGQDFAAGAGAQIQAIADGEVIEVVQWEKNDIADDQHSAGSYVRILHTIDGQSVISTYAHLAYQSTPLKVGDKVRVGMLVGLVGNTGQSTAAHLHLGIKVEGKFVDPMVWLADHNASSAAIPDLYIP